MYIIARTAGGLDLAAIDINPREPWPGKCFFLLCCPFKFEKIFKVANFNYKLLRKWFIYLSAAGSVSSGI